MQQIVALFLVIIIFSAIWSVIKQHHDNQTTKSGKVIDISESWIDSSHLPYHCQEHLLEDRELELYQNLAYLLLGSTFVLCPKVRLAELLSVAASVENRQEYLNRIRVRAVDFLICELPGLTPKLAITLKDKSAAQELSADRFTVETIKAAKLPHLIYDRNRLPDAKQLTADLAKFGLQVNR